MAKTNKANLVVAKRDKRLFSGASVAYENRFWGYDDQIRERRVAGYGSARQGLASSSLPAIGHPN